MCKLHIKEEYKEYVLGGEELWIFTLNKVKKFINDNENRPNKRSTNPEEKKLGQWISNQNKKYKNNIVNRSAGVADIRAQRRPTEADDRFAWPPGYFARLCI